MDIWLLKKLREIKVLILDFDGVLTDCYVYTDQDGREIVRCSKRDSMGINLLKNSGIKVVVLSSERNLIVSKRCEKIGVECYQNILEKLTFLKRYVQHPSFLPSEIAYMGDDINDLECLEFIKKAGGFAAAPHDCTLKLQSVVHYITSKKGGNGAVREICDLILEAKRTGGENES